MKNFLLVGVSNTILLFLSIIISFLLPKILSVESYGYWQLYLYYGTYLGIFMFGFLDGMNIRYAGIDKSSLDHNLMKKFLMVVIILSSCVSIILGIVLMIVDVNNKTLLLYLIINIGIFNLNGFCIHLNQMTSSFKVYSIANIIEKSVFVLFLIVCVFFNQINYHLAIILSIISRLVALLYNLYSIQYIFKNKQPKKDKYFFEIKENFKAGFPLNIATILTTLIITSPRIIVQMNYSIEEYAYFSLGFTTINMVLQIILALSTVIYPTLKKISYKETIEIYFELKNTLILFSLLGLIGYYFVYTIVLLFLKEYHDVLKYLYLLFPLIAYQTVNSLLVSVYVRLQRLERKYFLVNLVTIFIIILFTIIISKNNISIEGILFIINFSLYVWNKMNLASIEKKMSSNRGKVNYKFEIILLVFICLNKYFNMTFSFFVYIFFFTLVYLKEIKQIFIKIK